MNLWRNQQPKMPFKKLILFDIDGTLMDSGGAGKTAMELAVNDTFGFPDGLKEIDFAGSTDLWIISQTLRKAGMDHNENLLQSIIKSYLEHLPRALVKAKGSLKPGAERLVSMVSSSNDMLCGLLTGNIQRGAMLKLSHFNIDSHFKMGAFGDDNQDRNKLLPIAVNRAYETSTVKFDYRDCILIGDTPKDVIAAKIHGAKCLGVATGPYSTEQLLHAGAFAALEDFSDTDRVFSLLND